MQEVVEAAERSSSVSDDESDRGQSPSGEGRRLGDSSHNGSSSGLAGAGAARHSGDGGLQTRTQKTTDDDDDEELPGYSNNPLSGEKRLDWLHHGQEGMDFYENNGGFGGESDSYNPLHNDYQQPSWSFNRVLQAYGPSSQMTAAPPASISDNDELLNDDNDSTKAVSGGDISDSETRLASLADSPGLQGAPHPGTPMDESYHQIPNLDPSLTTNRDDDDEDEDMPVVELQANDEQEHQNGSTK